MLHCLFKINKIININNNSLLPSLAKFSPRDRKQGINKCWPNGLLIIVWMHTENKANGWFLIMKQLIVCNFIKVVTSIVLKHPAQSSIQVV